MTVFTEALQVWIAAVEEGYFGSPAWVPWAERALQSATPVPPWLVDLCYAADAGSALPLLYAGLDSLSRMDEVARAGDLTALRLGMSWLRYERGELSLEQLLSHAGDIADRANYDSPSCEAFYALLNDVEGGFPAGPACAPGAVEATRLLAPHAALARTGLLRILVGNS